MTAFLGFIKDARTLGVLAFIITAAVTWFTLWHWGQIRALKKERYEAGHLECQIEAKDSARKRVDVSVRRQQEIIAALKTQNERLIKEWELRQDSTREEIEDIKHELDRKSRPIVIPMDDVEPPDPLIVCERYIERLYDLGAFINSIDGYAE